MIEQNVENPIRFILYNVNTKTTRECRITPTLNWDVENPKNSLLGFDLAQGFLHQISDNHLQNNINFYNINSHKISKYGGIVEKAQLDSHVDCNL